MLPGDYGTGDLLASDGGFMACRLGLVLGWDHVCPAFFYPMQLLLWWVIGGVVDFQECIWC